MRTEKQIAASRANGAKSRGRKPRPANPWADYSALGEALLIEGESPGLFDDLATQFAEHLQPQSPVDHLLIGNMLAAHWRKTRLWHREQQKGDPISIEETRLDRQFYRAFDRYMKMRLNSSPEGPATQTPVSTCGNPEPTPEPTETQPEPDKTQGDAAKAALPNTPDPPPSRADLLAFAKLIDSIVLAVNPAAISKYTRNPRLGFEPETDLRHKEL